jgi:hypothetical protein
MKVIPILLVALLVAARGSAQSPAVIEGRVVTGSGDEVRPVRRATVTLSGRGVSPRDVETDVQGRYRFEKLARGEYRIRVYKPGYLHWIGDAEPDATITMIRGGAIEGVVLDPSGEPLRGVAVSALEPPSGRAACAVPAADAATRSLLMSEVPVRRGSRERHLRRSVPGTYPRRSAGRCRAAAVD